MSRLPDANLKMVPRKELEDLLMMNRIIENCIIRIYLFVFNDTIEGGRDPGAAPQDTFCILYSVICLRGNGVIRRTQKVIQHFERHH